MVEAGFWRDRRVFVTGHTGFKGSWLCIWLHMLGAKVSGYSLEPPTEPSLYEVARVGGLVGTRVADIRDRAPLEEALCTAAPEVVIHMAAQSLVRESYESPAYTYETNVMGTVNLLEAVRRCGGVKAVVNVTSDKCYENKGVPWAYKESDPLGGYDPYSSSKACAEIVSTAYRSSFFNPASFAAHGVGLASARAGNVVGGGDWAKDRLVPDMVRAILKGREIVIRNPAAVRPWQHVLEPLSGYLELARRLFDDGPGFSEGWNFGPQEGDSKTVEELVRMICQRWEGASYKVDQDAQPHEAAYLRLDSEKARLRLGWRPRWSLDRAIGSIVDWVRAYRDGKDMLEVCMRQIEEYSAVEGA